MNQAKQLFGVVVSFLLIGTAQANTQFADTSPQLMISTPSATQPALLMNSHLSGQVNGLLVSMTMVQEFKNDSVDWVNGRYVFPLPTDAVVDSLTLTNQDRVLRGVVKEKQQAKKEFEQAKSAGKKAGLLEQSRPNLFAMSMANIAPQSVVKAEITWVQKVDYEGGVFSLSLPTTLTPRYIPRQTLQYNLSALAAAETEANMELHQGWLVTSQQQDDAELISPPQVSGLSLEDSHYIDIDIQLNAGLPLDTIASSSHAIDVQQHGDSHQIRFKNKHELMDHDVLLQWQVAAQAIPKAAVFSEQKSDGFYQMFMINPPVKNIVSTLPKDVTFIIDTSGSMAGSSLQQAKQGLVAALDQLSNKDRFNIIEFNSDASQLYEDSKLVTQHSLHNAKRFVGRLNADGGTEMMKALQLAFQQTDHQQYLRQIIFITDGAVGNEKALFSYIHQQLGNARLFTVGIGSAPNNYFMQGAAKYGRGSSTLITNLSEVNSKMTRLFEKLTYPVMRDIQIAWPEGVEVESYPSAIPDLYVAEPLLLMARSDKPIKDITVTGQIAGQEWQQQLTINNTENTNNINKVWALDKVNALIEKAVLFAEPLSKYKEQIVKIGVENQIVTRFTSFVAIEEFISRPDTALARDEHVPNLSPRAKLLSTPSTATPAGLHISLGLLLLLGTVAYRRFTNKHNKEA
jgi:Ca-activated chloride channel family protein